ncbi:MAG: hypothetical protein AAFY45_13090 [Bacteroidota bacterium]
MKKAFISALLSGTIFAILMSLFDHFGDDDFSVTRFFAYFFLFSAAMTLVNLYSDRRKENQNK